MAFQSESRCVRILCVYLWLISLATKILSLTHDGKGNGTSYDEDDDGGKHIIPPLPRGQPYPALLHERDIIRHVDMYQEFFKIGSGTHALISLAELRGSKVNQFVVVKSFKDSSFSRIMLEARMHRYVEPLNITPRLIGLLPAGRNGNNISLVYEYIPFSMSASDWLDYEPSLSTIQWLCACVEVVRAVRLIHSYDVIFNDLHTANIIIQEVDKRVKVYLIDFGLATYIKGKNYTNENGSLDAYHFIAPEAKNNQLTTKESDIFSIGYFFHKLARALEFPKLKRLSLWCTTLFQEDRPTPDAIERKLKELLFEQWLISLPGSWPKPPDLSLRDILSFREQFSQPRLKPETESQGRVDSQESSLERYANAKLFHETPIWKWLMELDYPLFNRCPQTIYVLDYHEVLLEALKSKIKTSSTNAIYLSLLRSNKETVIIKEFRNTAFGTIRTETCVTLMLGSQGIAPKVYGILPSWGYTTLEETSFVQEFYGIGKTLFEYVNRVKNINWGYDLLEKSASAQFDYSVDYSPLSEYCRLKRTQAFREVIFEQRSVCPIKSQKQKVLEKAAISLAHVLKRVHTSGLLLNNLNRHNVLVKWNNSSRSLDVRLIDLNRVSGFEGTVLYQKPDYLSKFMYLAREVRMAEPTSRKSDVYSLCYILHWLLSDFISENARKMRHQKSPSAKNHELCDSTNPGKRANVHDITQSDRQFQKDSAGIRSMHCLHGIDNVLIKCLQHSKRSRPTLETILRKVSCLG